MLPGSGAETPLLLSKELIRGLKAKLDMVEDQLVLGRYEVTIQLKDRAGSRIALSPRSRAGMNRCHCQIHYFGASELTVRRGLDVMGCDVCTSDCSGPGPIGL